MRRYPLVVYIIPVMFHVEQSTDDLPEWDYATRPNVYPWGSDCVCVRPRSVLSVLSVRLPVGRAGRSLVDLVARLVAVCPVGRSSCPSSRSTARTCRNWPKRGGRWGDGWPLDGRLVASVGSTPPQMPPQMPHLRRCAVGVQLRGCGLDLACAVRHRADCASRFAPNKTRGLRVIWCREKKIKTPP